MKGNNNNLDSLLSDIGDFGRYQRCIVLMIMYVTVINFFSMVIYVFETIPVNHRCKIAECDNGTSEYNPHWLLDAVPFNQNKPARCVQFKHNQNDTCEPNGFNNRFNETCGTFVYETAEISIMHDFNLHCDENMKVLTMVGTVNGIGKFIGLPVAGIFSDRYGRKTMLIFAMVVSGAFGIMRSFSTSYSFFIVLEFLDSLFGAGAYASAYVLGSEFVGPKKRALVATIQFVSYAMGSIILGSTAWLFQSWRPLVRVLYSFYLVVLVYCWLLPESVRWLLSKNKQEKAIAVIRQIAKINKKEISEGKLESLLSASDCETTTSLTLRDLFRSPTLMLRCAICSFGWMSCIFVYYGLQVTSTMLSGNRYLDFLLTSSIEVPAYITVFFVTNRLGRRISLLAALVISSISSIGFTILPSDIYWVKLLLYLVSKFGITMSVPTIYMITNEMFPTSLRQSLLSICSMFGRIGNILVPQLFLLIEIWKNLPSVIFACLTGTAALLTLLLPETKDITLPDTIEQAENIGKKATV